MTKKQFQIIFVLLLFIISTVSISCSNKTTCPAYMDGKVTGTSGSSSKGKPLWPKNMKKQKN